MRTIEEKREYQRQWRAKNKERLTKKNKIYHLAHKDEAKERSRQWKISHKHPCAKCGQPCDYRNKTCQTCYRKWVNLPKRYCLKCGSELGYHNRSGFCKRCGLLKALADGTIVRQKGEHHPNWKGGQRITKDGYIMVYQPEHPNAIKNYILEHRLIAEQTIGRLLKKSEIVHHLNGIRTDNRPSNLAVVTPKTHSNRTFIKQLQQRIRELEQLHLTL